MTETNIQSCSLNSKICCENYLSSWIPRDVKFCPYCGCKLDMTNKFRSKTDANSGITNAN